ncbi:hypothetical protein Dimus_033052 [Dionaea muscipula]
MHRFLWCVKPWNGFAEMAQIARWCSQTNLVTEKAMYELRLLMHSMTIGRRKRAKVKDVTPCSGTPQLKLIMIQVVPIASSLA